MNQKLIISTYCFGFIGQLIIVLTLVLPITFLVNELGIYYLPLFLIPFALMSLSDETIIDLNFNKYRYGYTFFGSISFSKWHELNNKCYLKIEPIAKVISFDSGRINHGSMTKFETALYLIDPMLKNKMLMKQGKYKLIEKQGTQIAQNFKLRLKNYKK